MERIAIIVVAYNRPDSLKRLLNYLNMSDYNNEKVDLIISMDKSDVEDQILDVANAFNWKYGQKNIRTFPKRQGLRNHVLQCGDYSYDYDAIVMFEDDIIPAKNYYKYIKEALEFYGNDERVAGISLYSPMINEMVEKPFVPLVNDSDVYFIQSAQSWGQCWSKTMWHSFRRWYVENSEELIQADDMPEKIYSWPNSSWKKYYMKYLVSQEKYFVYPYVSLSTNASEMGEHVKKPTSRYQVPILYGKKDYKFSPIESSVVYDSFFENSQIVDYLATPIDSLCVDLYGSKSTNLNKRYLITPKKLDYKIIKKYSLSLKPQELNIMLNNLGEELFLYDLETEKTININKRISSNKILDYYSLLNWQDSLSYGLYGFRNAISKRVINLLRK